MGLMITLLGNVAIGRAGEQPQSAESLGASPQVRMAFAMLTLGRDEGITRDALAEALWPTGLPRTWRSSLRTVVSRVRALVGRVASPHDGELLATRDGIYYLRLSDDVSVDLEVAERHVAKAAQALAENRPGSALSLALSAVPCLRTSFLPEHQGEWIEARRAQLAQTLLVGLEVTSQAASAEGDNVGVIAAAIEAVDRAPLRESAHRCVMAAPAAAGNRAEAVQAYQRLRRLLAEELGVDPHEETETAYIALLGPVTAPLDSRRERPTVAGPGEAAPFVGRDAAIADARGVWEQVVATATSRLVVAVGEPGAGKTRFATEFSKTLAGDGALVLFGRCDPDTLVPYQPLVEAFDALIAVAAREPAGGLSAAACTELAAVFPSFPGGAAIMRSGNRTVLFDAVTTTVRNAALGHPILVVVDDCHWADADSALLVRHLLRHAGSIPLMVVATLDRNRFGNHPFAETVSMLVSEGKATHLQLGGLDEAAGRALVRWLRPQSDGLLAAVPEIVADTGGN